MAQPNAGQSVETSDSRDLHSSTALVSCGAQHRNRMGRLFLLGIIGVAIISAAAIFSTTQPAKAWQAGFSGSNVLVGYNSSTFQFASFPWQGHSGISYTKVWDNGWYTRMDSQWHEVKTNSNWPAYSSYLWGTPTTYLYSGGVYMWTYGPMNGSCVGQPWTYWNCDSGTDWMIFLGDGSAYFNGTLTIGGGGWGTYGGSSISGWYYWSAP